jgi:hypothetical protein
VFKAAADDGAQGRLVLQTVLEKSKNDYVIDVVVVVFVIGKDEKDVVVVVVEKGCKEGGRVDKNA